MPDSPARSAEDSANPDLWDGLVNPDEIPPEVRKTHDDLEAYRKESATLVPALQLLQAQYTREHVEATRDLVNVVRQLVLGVRRSACFDQESETTNNES